MNPRMGIPWPRKEGRFWAAEGNDQGPQNAPCPRKARQGRKKVETLSHTRCVAELGGDSLVAVERRIQRRAYIGGELNELLLREKKNDFKFFGVEGR